jgi:hypothetical protein
VAKNTRVSSPTAGKQSKQNTMPSEKYGFRFRVNSNGAVKNMRHVSTKCEMNLLHEVKKKSPQMQTARQTPVLEDKGRYEHTTSRYLESISHYKIQLTYKCIVNNNVENIK